MPGDELGYSVNYRKELLIRVRDALFFDLNNNRLKSAESWLERHRRVKTTIKSYPYFKATCVMINTDIQKSSINRRRPNVR